MTRMHMLQSLSTLEVKDSDLEATLAALKAAVQELGNLSHVDPERAAAEAAQEELEQRVAAQQALEDTMASVRRISTSDGAASRPPHPSCFNGTACICIASICVFELTLTCRGHVVILSLFLVESMSRISLSHTDECYRLCNAQGTGRM
jgi:hypothetical protein